MKTLLVLLLATFTVSCSKTPKPIAEGVKEKSTQQSSQEFFVQGNKHLEAKEWEKAVESYSQADENVKRWDIYLNRGIAQIQMGRFNDAINSFDLALKNGGEKESVIYFNLGNLYQERGLYQDAVNSYRAGLVYVPAGKTDPDMITNLGAAYVFLSQWDAANETFNHLKSIAPNSPAADHGLGMVFQLQGKYVDAIKMYEQVNTAFPDFAMSYYTKAQCFGRKKQWEKAIEAYESYKRVYPDSKYLSRIAATVDRYKKRLGK